MDKIRQKAQSLLEKLHDKYGVQSKHHIHVVLATMGKKEGEAADLQDHWYLVDTHGQKFRLPKTMLFLGSDECDVIVASQSVDKRHAILAFDIYLNRFKVKDLSTRNGTYVNNSRIPEQEYVALNHMDSIRLGQDAMMYHMEQASQITSHGGLLPDPHFVPSWASRNQDSTTTIHVHTHDIAECQGCITEQNLEHSCSLKPNKSTDHQIHLEDPHHSHRQPRHTCTDHPQDHGHHVRTVPPLIPRGELGCQVDHSSDQPVHHHQEHAAGFGQEQSFPHGDQPAAVYGAAGEGRQARNSCPVSRQKTEAAAVSTLFNMGDPESQDTAHSRDNPDSRVPTAMPVSVDDSCGNTNNSTSICAPARRPHNNKNPSPPELNSKKGTPLYGQPAWWGDERGSDQGETSAGLPKHNGDGLTSSKATPPISPVLNGGKMESPPVPITALPKTGSIEADFATKATKGPTYMEIPLRDDDSTDGLEKSSKAAMAAAKYRRSSLTKESLSMSPDLKQPSKTAKTQSPGAEVNPATSFTIDLDDPEHPPKKSLNIGSSISEFVPSKIRKNFQDRKNVSSKVSLKESTPSKYFDEPEISALSQSKIDEIWTTVVEAKGKSRLSNIQSETGTSLRSPNLNDISQFSQPSQERRKSLEKDGDKRSSVKRPVSGKSPQTSQPSKVDLSSDQKFGSESPTISVLPKLDPASYLIDRMFEVEPKSAAQASKEHFPEQPSPKAEAGRNQATQSTMEKALVRPVINSTSSSDTVTKTLLEQSKLKPVVHRTEEADEDDLLISEDISSDTELREKDDREDKISEAGTYTIEADVVDGHEEEEEARRRIDHVFGVDIDNPLIDQLIFNESRDDYVHDLGDDSEHTILDDSQSPGEDDTDLITDEFDDETSDVTDTNGLHNWVSQLTSLTSHKSAVSNKIMQEESEVSLTKKPPQGINRKRPGTGRKLPSIPSDKIPVSSDSSLPLVLHNLKTGEDLLVRKSLGYDASGRLVAGSSSKYTVSSSQRSPLKTGFPATQSISAYSHPSLETEVSFQGAAMVTGAVQNRNPYKLSHDSSISQDSDMDASSVVALVNGSDSHVRPVLYKSPRDALAKRQAKDTSTKPGKPSSTPPSVLGKKPDGKSPSQIGPTQRNVTTPRSTPASTPTSGTRKSSSSDVFSRKDSLDNGSTISDVSSEAGDGIQLRSSSKGKAAITLTRTNKTFELRRARADSLDGPSTFRSSKSASSSKPGSSASVGRPHSLYSNLKNKSFEATNFEAQVIKKMQSHITQEKIHKSKTVSSKTDSGKHILNQGLQRASSLTISHPIPSSKRESTPKSLLRTAPIGKSSLTITGIGNRGTQSQPGSRSGSPKSAEKMAWKRRKEYDARKSVAVAKATKGKECNTSGVSLRPKPSASASINRAMTRSASFTNTAAAGLSFGLHSSVSSSQDFSDRSSSHHQQKDFFKAFLPVQTPHHNGRSTHSADEDDSLASANSTQDSARIVASLLGMPSAFTPPLARNKDVSPENSSSPSEASLTLRRRLLNLDGESSPSLSKSLHVIGNERDLGRSSTESSPQTSYDSLIVTSVYQLSQKLKTTTDTILSKLNDHGKTTQMPSPVDDFLNDSGRSEIMAWKTANQELASTLKNLRMLERHMQKINVTLFPDVDASSDGSSHTPAKQQIQQKMLEDIERKYGFQPIDQPASPEMEELSGQFDH